MIRVTYECGGCDATATAHIRQRFRSVFGDKDYGFGWLYIDDVQDVAPEGWVPFDRIGATYCPRCWAEIVEATDG